MKVLVDTSVWSAALRRKKPSAKERSIAEVLAGLIRDLRVTVLGPVRQELLSGISDADRFEDLRQKFAVFPDHPLVTADYELAARCANECRVRGVQGSTTDFLLCAVALRHDFVIFTLDADFEKFRKIIPVKLFAAG